MPQVVTMMVVLSEIRSLRRYLAVGLVLILTGLTLNGVRVVQVNNQIMKLRRENTCLRHLVDTNQKGSCDAKNQ